MTLLSVLCSRQPNRYVSDKPFLIRSSNYVSLREWKMEFLRCRKSRIIFQRYFADFNATFCEFISIRIFNFISCSQQEPIYSLKRTPYTYVKFGILYSFRLSSIFLGRVSRLAVSPFIPSPTLYSESRELIGCGFVNYQNKREINIARRIM